MARAVVALTGDAFGFVSGEDATGGRRAVRARAVAGRVLSTRRGVLRALAWPLVGGCAGPAPAPGRRHGFTARTAFASRDAVQGVAVDGGHLYAIGTSSVSKHDRASGRLRARWRASDGHDDDLVEVRHLNGGSVRGGELFVAHSDWPAWPPTSSIEVFDAASLRRVRSIRLPRDDGALAWVDWNAAGWWGAFARYDAPASAGASAGASTGATVRAPAPATDAGGTRATRLASFDAAFGLLRRWSFPDSLAARLAPMSVSGGSWGPDGRLWLTGHDRAEAYVVRVPRDDGPSKWCDTAMLPGVEGQGIAWDRSGGPATLYGIRRSRRSVIELRRGP